MNKIEEAQKILHDLGLPQQQQNKISALTLLSLAGLKKDDEWNLATKKSLTLSKDIMEFVNDNYEPYKPNTRESFRNIALKPFVEYNIALLNPDDSTLKPSSSKTHYSLSDLALSTIRKFKTNEWSKTVEYFKLHQFPENLPSSIMLRKVIINNYKSILNDSIQLGRFNVFIGVNGCGKTNILEAIATVGAAKADDFNFEGLYSRGVRIARPNLVKSSFLNTLTIDTIEFDLEFEENEKKHNLKSTLYPENENDVYTKWSDNELYRLNSVKQISRLIERVISEFDKKGEPLIREKIFEEVSGRLHLNLQQFGIERIEEILSNYAIFDLNTKSLRGITPADSRKTPLGLNGEGLDLLIANFNVYEKDYLNKCKFFFDWLEDILSDKNDKYKLQGLKPGRSTSSLYFTDKYMQKQNNIFSAENSNEGVLHVLFYLALFISNKTPEFFAIDNIETALNPRLCQGLIKELVNLSKERGKQVLITTHNPAILDGLNLLDDEQRLFEVYRNSAGHTKTRRIKFKSDLSDKKFKLSEMWLKGQLGAVPQNF
jgi:predicted ATPase